MRRSGLPAMVVLSGSKRIRLSLILALSFAQLSTAQAAVVGAATELPKLTRQEAERLALAKNPSIHVSELLARIQGQVVRETRANELPALTGQLTAVEADQGSRLAAGALSASRLLQHAGGGVQLSQLITDFGRTRNLVASARLRARAREAEAQATRDDIILATDQVFYQGVEAQATLRVAQQTVEQRQTLADQVQALTTAKLKSDLDLSFVQVNLSQARLLVLSAQTNLDAAEAALAAVLGSESNVRYELVEGADDLPPLPAEVETAVAEALNNRPDLRSSTLTMEAAQRFSTAQRQQSLPTVNALGVVGGIPWGSSQFFTSNWYGAAGLNVSIPVFNGFRFKAQAAEAALQVTVEQEHVRSLRNQIARDVRTAWLTANTDRQRVTVSEQLLQQTNLALSLAQSRYQLGLSSIVELSQAQLQQTQAATDAANARSEYNFARAELRTFTGSNIP